MLLLYILVLILMVSPIVQTKFLANRILGLVSTIDNSTEHSMIDSSLHSEDKDYLHYHSYISKVRDIHLDILKSKLKSI